MLIGNGSIILKSPGRFLSGGGASVLRSSFSHAGMKAGRYCASGGRTFALTSASPSGYYIGSGAMVRPRKAGEISSFLKATLEVTGSAYGWMGLPGGASTSFSIQFADAEGQLIVSGIGSSVVSITTNTPLLTASLSGSGSSAFTITTNTPLLGALASGIGGSTFTITGTLTPFATGLLDGLAKLAGDIVVLNDYGGSVYLSEDGADGIEYPAGTSTFPVKTMSGANYIANKYGLKNYYVRGNYTLEQAHTNTTFYGLGPQQFSKLNLDNQMLDGVLFYELTLEGQLNTATVGGLGWQSARAKVEFHDCYLHEIIDLQGNLVNCTIDGATSIKAGGWASGSNIVIEGDNTVFDMRSTSGTTVSMDIASGWSQFINAVTGSLIELNVKGGEVSLDASCTGGEYYVEGVGTLYNDSAMVKKENHFIWDELLEGSYSSSDIQRIMAASLAGKVSGADTSAPVFRSIDDTKNRISATTTGDGNRTTVVLDAT